MDGIDAGRVTYLVIDGENLDATLGVNLLGHRPAPDERPRWERVLEFA
ncbi:MAG: nuclease, partial [Pseudorhodobacter sp.]|nr:nuclease [Frankiaceae bacterium]